MFFRIGYILSINFYLLLRTYMEIDEFETQTYDKLETALNQLQTATLLLSALEMQISESGNTVKDLSRVIETFITSKRDNASGSRPTWGTQADINQMREVYD